MILEIMGDNLDYRRYLEQRPLRKGSLSLG